jgi:hypothetical protein
LHAPGRRGVAGADPIERALALVREQLRMSVSFVSGIVDGREVVCHMAGDGGLASFVAGAALPLADPICERLLAGRIGDVVPDVAPEPGAGRSHLACADEERRRRRRNRGSDPWLVGRLRPRNVRHIPSRPGPMPLLRPRP